MIAKISNILFSPPTEIKPEETSLNYEVDPEKTVDFNENYLFNKFHHLFEYDATYYSYLLAKVASQKLYTTGVVPVGSDENIAVTKEIH